MKKAVKKTKIMPEREALPEIRQAAPGELQAIEKSVKGQREQTVLPDDYQFGDNDPCSVDR